ncbi:hypothetical protein QQ008_18420 [Fulvivirgaceae bacterium BMA10]|uniref:Uncharacterized protein n=1 Tax=Splendidivirga corallicola TaxID=3051826 RepID=A0ABT8KSH9_9BACT|nr:hypothetical protein [Fulvivirgaceae bacterium BMA10]
MDKERSNISFTFKVLTLISILVGGYFGKDSSQSRTRDEVDLVSPRAIENPFEMNNSLVKEASFESFNFPKTEKKIKKN